MARAMNVVKRANAIAHIITKTKKHSARALKIAHELQVSFGKGKSKDATHARHVANSARKVARALKRAAASV